MLEGFQNDLPLENRTLSVCANSDGRNAVWTLHLMNSTGPLQCEASHPGTRNERRV